MGTRKFSTYTDLYTDRSLRTNRVQNEYAESTGVCSRNLILCKVTSQYDISTYGQNHLDLRTKTRRLYTSPCIYTQPVLHIDQQHDTITRHLKSYPNPNFNFRVRYVKYIWNFSNARWLPKLRSRRSRHLNVMYIILIKFRNDVPT